MPSFPPFRAFLTSPRDIQADVLSLLFEPCDVLQSLIFRDVLNTSNYVDYPDMIEAVRTALSHLLGGPMTTRVSGVIQEIIAAHPRLGAKKVESKLSQAEQASLTSNEAETNILNGLNEQYEKVFPGLRYVVFVNGRSRPIIFEDMTRRINRNDYDLECEEAFQVSLEQ